MIASIINRTMPNFTNDILKRTVLCTVFQCDPSGALRLASTSLDRTALLGVELCRPPENYNNVFVISINALCSSRSEED